METPLAVGAWLADRQRRSWIVACLVFAALLLLLLRSADPTTHVAVAMLCLLSAVLVAWVGGDLAPTPIPGDPPGTLFGPPTPLVSAVAHDLEAVGVSALCAPICMPQPPPRRTPRIIVPLRPRMATLRTEAGGGGGGGGGKVDPITLAPLLPAAGGTPQHQD